jgi:hypothetical protein
MEPVFKIKQIENFIFRMAPEKLSTPETELNCLLKLK